MASLPSLGDQIQRAPAPFDRTGVDRLREAWGANWAQLSANEAALLESAAGCSPYLRRMMARTPQRVLEILKTPPAETIEIACKAAHAAGALEKREDTMRALRAAKKDAALGAALADIAGAADAMQAAEWVSVFADAAANAAMVSAAARNSLPNGTAGIAAIAMGKLGAFELNYSSDIDLIIIYDAAMMGLDDGDARQQAVRVAKDCVAVLQDQTADGYVFRTDLRLRPDPGVSALAISATAAETYYESFGQNWERMAFIKARAHAGDIALGETFLAALRPFVWRKHLDFAAIDDVKAVKRQLHSAKGGGQIEFAGHDIKTGRGGIREIEFFAQTQQLILGGKNDALRSRGTLDAIGALQQYGHVSPGEQRDMSGAYLYLRHVEHRLQMINDEQTHKIPKVMDDIERVAIFSGEANTEAFNDKLRSVLETVKAHFDSLFREDALDVEQPGPLVFTGVEGDAATLQTLSDLGFERGREISRTIRRWHTGALRATRTERARILLTKLIAPLLLALSKSNDPDAAFFAFDEFLSRLPAGVQIFSLLANNVALFDALIEIITISPFLGREMSRRLNFVESLVEQGLRAPLPALGEYAPSIEGVMSGIEGDYEGALNAVRRWAGEARFFIAAKLAADAIDADVAASHFSAIADAAIRALTPQVEKEMRGQHGAIDGALAIVALGRLGAREMTASSDIDLIFVYDAPEGAQSDPGDGVGRALDGVEYFTRFVRRLVTALSAATQEGALYEVDMALRPSGGAGPAAVSLSAFRRYYKNDAWTWEVMALTKSRIVTGSPALTAALEAEIDAILKRPRDRLAVAHDVENMRGRLRDAKPGAGLWDVKYISGGLTDIEFIVQFLTLVSGQSIGRPPGATSAALEWFRDRNIIEPAQAAQLISAHHMFSNVLHAARAATGGVFDPAVARETLSTRMARVCGATSLGEAERVLVSVQGRVAKVYGQVLGIGSSETD